MNRRLATLVCAGTIVAELLAACSSGANAPPLGGTTTASTSTATAPQVLHPLDATRFLNAPCSALTTADLAAPGLQDPLTQNSPKPTGPGCAWQSGVGVGIDWVIHT